MAITLQQLLTPTTRQQALDTALSYLDNLGFTASSWQDGSVQRTIVEAVSRFYADSTTGVATIAEGVYNASSSGGWLDLVTQSFFDDVRTEATSTVGDVLFTSASGSPLHSWSAAELLLSDRPGGDPYPDGRPANLYRNTSAGSVAAASTATVEVQALSTGVAANIASGLTLYLLTPLSGVTVTNPADPTTLTWITTPGTDRESDSRLRTRNPLRWSTLAYGSPPNAYRRWAVEADETVTRVVVSEDGSGGVTVTCATATGGISGSQITTISEYVENGRRPINDDVTITSATVVSQSFVASPVIERGTTTAADIEAVITEYLGSLPIGGAVVAPSSVGAVIRDEVIERVMALPGVRRFALSTPSADILLSPDEVVVGSFSLAVTLVEPNS